MYPSRYINIVRDLVTTTRSYTYMVGKQGVAAPVSSRLVCQPCFICQLLHHCVNASPPPIIHIYLYYPHPSLSINAIDKYQ
jgi:hypothetical protein